MTIIKNSLQPIHTLFVFNHSGKEIPEGFEQFMNLNDMDAIRESIEANHDFGTEGVMEFLQDKIKEGQGVMQNAAVVFYPYTRIVADSNRITRESQITEQPYKGKGIWKSGVDKEMLGKQLVDPFFDEFIELLQQNPIKFVFYVHTMDEFGGGVASDGHELASKEERRPESMIFNKYQFKKTPYGPYGPDQPLDMELLTENQIRIIQKIHSKYLAEIPGLDEEHVDIPIDYPYVSPKQLCALTSMHFDGPQLILDVRKDLFATPQGKELINKSILGIAEVMTAQQVDAHLQVDPELHPLVDLMSINSYSTNKEGVDEKGRFIRDELFAGLPLEWQEFADDEVGNMLVAKSHQQDLDKPQIGLLLHSDTVHQAEIDMPIYVKDGKLYGPGAQDMQSSIFVVAKLLHDLESDGNLGNITVIINTAEELGSPAFQPELQQIAQELDYVMVYESGVEPELTNSQGNAAAGADQAISAETRESYKFGHTLVIERKGIFTQGIKTIGPGGHSGVLTKRSQRKNAISQAVQMMAAIDSLADYNKETTINMEHINGGQINTIIAQDCEFYFDARFRYESERVRLKTEIDRIMGTEYIEGVNVEDLGYKYDLPSLPPNDGSQEFLKLVEEVAAAHNIYIDSERRGGWSDGCNMYAYNNGLKVLDAFGPKGGGEHTRDEFVYIDSIWQSIELSKVVVEALLNNNMRGR